MEKTYLVSKDELPHFAMAVTRSLNEVVLEEAVVLALRGDLGAGKTTLVKEIAKDLGVVETLTSPTFVLMKFYQPEICKTNFQELVHIDAYRLSEVEEIEALGWEFLLKKPNTLICVEWPEIIQSVLPEKYFSLSLTVLDEETREVTTNFEIDFKF